MKYEKPNINLLASANCAIQGHIKDNSQVTDNPSTLPLFSINAYEADE